MTGLVTISAKSEASKVAPTSLSAVTATIGTSSRSWSLRISAARSAPLIPGIHMSVRTTSGLRAAIALSASSPEAASATSFTPKPRTCRSRILRLIGTSSTSTARKREGSRSAEDPAESAPGAAGRSERGTTGTRSMRM